MTTKQIWSDDHYESIGKVIELTALKRMKKSRYWPKKIKTQKHDPLPSSHRIENLVRRWSKELNEPLLHIGLTSSDIEDNVRATQTEMSIAELDERLTKITEELRRWIKKNNGVIMGRTHLLPAQLTTLERRFLPAIEVLENMTRPVVFYKGIGGAVGDNSFAEEFEVDLTGIFSLEQNMKNQTSNMTSDIDYITWASLIATYLSQICYNIRLSISYGDLILKGEKIGSSAMPHKGENPWRYEKICGLARRIYHTSPMILETIACNGLERTLDNQSILREELKKVSYTLEEMFDLFFLDNLFINPKRDKKRVDKEEEFIKHIKKGYCRTDAQRLSK